MKKVRITVVKVACYKDLMEKYEKPNGFCDSAWKTISEFVLLLSQGAKNFYDGWMKNDKSALISCNDGFRPVSFLLEAMDEDADLQTTININVKITLCLLIKTRKIRNLKTTFSLLQQKP